MPLTKTSMSEDEKEAPLDPAAERLQRRLTRLVRISGVTMAAGLIAVFSAILYRTVNRPSTAHTGAPLDIAVPAPSGATILSSNTSGDLLTMVVDAPEGRMAIVVDLRNGSVVARARLVTQPGT
ncbi:hypothetical protein [Segnochrobactrum spirostomi]|nr:hypothetical protein [Segnochrobactrum spirostomi]